MCVRTLHAFGQPFNNYGAEAQPYKYNGKELDNMHGLNMYDYAARYMDPAMGRFSSVDPASEEYYSISPYVYVLNNPLKYIDPDGKRGRPARNVREISRAVNQARLPARQRGNSRFMTSYRDGIRPNSKIESRIITYVARNSGNTPSPLESITTPGGNEVQMSRNNIQGRKYTLGIEFLDGVRQEILSKFTIYTENGPEVKNETKYNFDNKSNEATFGVLQSAYETEFASKMNKSIEAKGENVSFNDRLKISNSVQNELGASPKQQVANALKNREQESIKLENRIIPEFRQGN